MNCLFIVLSLLAPAALAANADLAGLIQCHDAIKDLGIGHTAQLSGRPTPFVLNSGGKLYFVTESSIFVIDNKFSDKEVVFKLQENGHDVFSKIIFNKDASLGLISFAPVTDVKSAVEPKALLDATTLGVITSDLSQRLKTMYKADEYKNLVDREKRTKVLNQCNSVKDPNFQALLAKTKLTFLPASSGKKTSHIKSAP